MFTGLIEEVGQIVRPKAAASVRGRLRILAAKIANEIHLGESVAVNGCCLTVAEHDNQELHFDLLGETVSRTNLGNLPAGAPVNLERALPTTGRLGGHFVQGHIDCTAPILAFEEKPGGLLLEVALPQKYRGYVVEKGSIAVDGISLTVAEAKSGSFVTWIVPHTRSHTNLAAAGKGDVVNLEFDLLAKYVDRLIHASPAESR